MQLGGSVRAKWFLEMQVQRKASGDWPAIPASPVVVGAGSLAVKDGDVAIIARMENKAHYMGC